MTIPLKIVILSRNGAIMLKISKYRISSSALIETIDNWERLINFKVNLIGCGGTALTLLEIKDSTKGLRVFTTDLEYSDAFRPPVPI